MRRIWTNVIWKILLLGMVLCTLSIFLTGPVQVEAQLTSRQAERIMLEIKKLNTRIVERVIPQIQNTNLTIENLKSEINKIRAEVSRVRSGNKTVNQQMEILSSVIPAMQGSMEQSQAQTIQEIQAMEQRFSQSLSKVKVEQNLSEEGQKVILDAIKLEVRANLQEMKEGALQEIIKSNEKRFNDQNIRVDKSIAVMTELAKGGSKLSEAFASFQVRMTNQERLLNKINERLAVF